MAIGHRHIMVNGRVCNSTHRLLRPGDVVEPVPRESSRHVIKTLFRRRLANNTFVLKKAAASRPAVAAGATERKFTEAAMRDGLALAESYRRLPPPDAADGGGASSPSLPAQAARDLDEVLPALVQALGDGRGLADALAARRGEVRVLAPAQEPGSPPPPATLVWDPARGGEGEGTALMTLNRAATRRLLLGLLALRPGGAGKAAPPRGE